MEEGRFNWVLFISRLFSGGKLSGFDLLVGGSTVCFLCVEKEGFSTLLRICERFACLMVTGNSTRDIGGDNSQLLLLAFQIYVRSV